ncbi:REP-associated tyrosine transposase [Sulfurovum mangrovi]|uniref:REP-associated tyrosine transposase n=1 Tax=Sulfurovum mangrovi TaxID=2893889 RepID=UPI001E55E619|nr:transposase [Sulfurovum mangrovi]UFH58073.1 transposase [Sulfurovum mangrovi]
MQYRRIYQDGFSYFITMVTYKRKPILIENINLLRDSFERSKQHYDYHIDAIVILPDHIHMIITPKNAQEYSKIIAHIKRSFVYGIGSNLRNQSKLATTPSQHKRGHAGIWQERFYEQTIRGEKDWLEKINYMKNNPVKHGHVDNIKDWKYSSFYKHL